MLRIGITCGDVTGVGPEVVVGALSLTDLSEVEWVVYGDRQVLEAVPGFRQLCDRLGTRLKICSPHRFELRPDLPPGDPQAARAALLWLEQAARDCLAGTLDAMVTAPVNKAAINRAGIAFTGQTEFLGCLSGMSKTVMMLLGPDEHDRWLRVSLVTTHVPLRQVADQISEEKVLLTCLRTFEACSLLGLRHARVAVTGLNPHAGEEGHLGYEEQHHIHPVVIELRNRGYDITGPLPADAAFHLALHGQFDAVVAMYHDQGLAPLKTVAFERGVNWTLGLPFIRTSPDHGTAYAIARSGKASPSSMLEAIRLAVSLAQQKLTHGWCWAR